jgi:uncharacterized membrane protein YdbT with pleckstrin-like domain
MNEFSRSDKHDFDGWREAQKAVHDFHRSLALFAVAVATWLALMGATLFPGVVWTVMAVLILIAAIFALLWQEVR